MSSINSIAALCESTGADVREVARAIGTDSRIGERLSAKRPWLWRQLFPKDILNLVYLMQALRTGWKWLTNYWEQVVELNTWQQQRIARLVVQRLFNTVAGKSIALLGFAFKADTNDTRESPAIRIAKELLEEGAQLAIHDPKVSSEQISLDLGQQEGQGEGNWHLASDPQSACQGADACLLLTEWSQYRQLTGNPSQQ